MLREYVAQIGNALELIGREKQVSFRMSIGWGKKGYAGNNEWRPIFNKLARFECYCVL